MGNTAVMRGGYSAHGFLAMTLVIIILFGSSLSARAATIELRNEQVESTLQKQASQLGLTNKLYTDATHALEQGDYSYAHHLFKTLAELGHTRSQFQMGNIYYNGYGVHRDVEDALFWFRKAAQSGHPQAQYNVGVAYAKGIGVESDISHAIVWWQRAALRGNVDAQFNLGMLYARGYGVKRDEILAARWWKKAAVAGDAAAQFNLGMMYANGEGVGQDNNKAIHWWRMAATQGYTQALELLQQLNNTVANAGDS